MSRLCNRMSTVIERKIPTCERSESCYFLKCGCLLARLERESCCYLWKFKHMKISCQFVCIIWKVNPCFFCCSLRHWGETMSLNYGYQCAYCSSPELYMNMESHGGMILTVENWRAGKEICPSATLSTTNNTWANRGLNPGLRGQKPVFNRLSNGTTLYPWLLWWSYLYDIISPLINELQEEKG
jgi:hypothetical protein